MDSDESDFDAGASSDFAPAPKAVCCVDAYQKKCAFTDFISESKGTRQGTREKSCAQAKGYEADDPQNRKGTRKGSSKEARKARLGHREL
jgi:hypothetical protein